MNNKKSIKKSITGITLAAIMIASIFAMVVPSVTAPGVLSEFGLGKETTPDPEAKYSVGDTIDYIITATDIDPNYNCTVTITDTLPNGSTVVLDTDSFFVVGEVKTYPISYTVEEGDVLPPDSLIPYYHVINYVKASGLNEVNDNIDLTMSKTSEILRKEPPEFDFTWEEACCLRMNYTGETITPEGEVDYHEWDFGVGATPATWGPIYEAPSAANAPPTVVYSSGGTKTVTLSGCCEQGQCNETSHAVYVDKGPTADADATPKMIAPGETVTFYDSGSEADPVGDRSIVSCEWEIEGKIYDATDGCIPPDCTVAVAVNDPPETATLTVFDGHCYDSDEVTISSTAKCKIRVYGLLDFGAGDRCPDGICLCPENPPYTDAIAPFFPQAEQAPEMDFITFNPISMDHGDKDWDNDDENDYVYRDSIKAGLDDANEKEFFRMWYEPTEWIKDEDADGNLDIAVVCVDEEKCEDADIDCEGCGFICENGHKTNIHLEELHKAHLCGYEMLPFNEDGTLADIYAPSIKQEFTFMFLDTDNNPITAPTGTSKFLVPMASEEDDNGIDSFDADGDGKPDSVVVCSEANLGDVNNDGFIEQLDIDGDGDYETLSDDGETLSGDETLVLRLDTQRINEGERIQFFDFEIELEDTTEAGRAILNIYYKGNPDSWGDEWIGTVDLGADLLPTAGSSVATFERGGVNTHISPRGPGFVWVTNVDNEDGYAMIVVGRMFGETWANIGEMYDDGEAAWGYQKHFYVDGVLYNVVAIMTEGEGDAAELKYVTFRVKLTKVPIWIENHSTQLIGWRIGDILPVMPQFNMNHRILEDVWPEWDDVKIGDPRELETPLMIVYVDETIEPRFHGELKEILCEPGYYPCECEQEEGWFIEWFQTLPREYTEFVLQKDHGLYLLTSAFTAPESCYHYWDDGELLDSGEGSRLKFWYDDCTGPLFIDNATDSLRIYGTLDFGAGDRSMDCENPPYTDAIAPFFPQAEQAPRKDFITFNPIIMDHDDWDWDNDGENDRVYRDSIKAGLDDANEKEFFRMWYEPTEWIKDENADGKLDVAVVCVDEEKCEEAEVDCEGCGFICENGHKTNIHLEELHKAHLCGYEMLPFNEDGTLADIYAPSIKQEFTFMFLDTYNNPITAPTGTSKFLVPMASEEEDNGIDSFDADGDGKPDSVVVCSEANLGDVNSDGIPDQLDIDGDGKGATGFETLSDAGGPLSGDETLVLRLDTKKIYKDGRRIQFFDFEIELDDTTEAGHAILNIYYKGNPNSYGDELIGTVDLGADLIPGLGTSFATFERGGVNTAKDVRGPGFVWVTNVDNEDGYARIIVGRMFGETWANIGEMYDDGEAAWGYQKHFYVDGVLYNVVAIMTEGEGDAAELKYVTFRVKLTKVPIWIENHSTQLLGWDKDVPLPVMPQFNMEHHILLDVQAKWSDEKKGEGADVLELEISYVDEDIEERFHGELREILGEPGYYPWDMLDYDEEGWWIEWFQTIPYQYTAFKLPEGHGLYLITSAFRAPESCYHYWDGGELLDADMGSRLKFWYDPADNTDIYVNRLDGMPEPPTIDEYYDSSANSGDGDGEIDLNEIVKAIMSCLAQEPPFGPGGFDIDDLLDYFDAYLEQEGY